MSKIPFESPVEDSVPKVQNAIAVGEDIEFQRKWWRFEKIIWAILLAIVLFDVLGGFGRGWLANACKSTPDGALTLNYERVMRASTPSVLTMQFGDTAIHNGRIILFISDSVVKRLGAQRVSPQPAVSSVGEGGITYVFPASQSPATLQIQLEPSFPGPQKFRIQAEGSAAINGQVFVMP